MRNMPPLGGPVEVVVEAFMMVPASWSLKKRLSAIAGQIKPITKPDLDNIVKALDGMNGIVVVDDSQIVKLTATKQYAETPQLLVTVIGQE
jgi:Holliday junction resolvase RusA-like endonuclease